MIKVFVDNSDDNYYLLSENENATYDGYTIIGTAEGSIKDNGLFPDEVYNMVFNYKPELLLYGFNVKIV